MVSSCNYRGKVTKLRGANATDVTFV